MLGTPMNEALETLFDVRADTSTEAVVEMESNTLPVVWRTNYNYNQRQRIKINLKIFILFFRSKSRNVQ